jgi:carbon-monoxide dehydrogenase medium subunit
MKIPPIDYACPTSLSEATRLLAQHGGDAKPIAGGQSLMPLLAFRMASPKLLVDLRRIPGLGSIAISDKGVSLGASVRWRDIESHPGLKTAYPLLPATIAHVAHYQIRNRGTVGGSLAHADPAAEMPGLAVACDAEIIVEGTGGQRQIPARDFFLGALTTVLEPDELIIEIRLPPWPASRKWAFEEFSMRRGDFAMAGVTVFYDLDAEGQAQNAHVGVIGATDIPRRVEAAERALNGRIVDQATIAVAARAAAGAIDPPSDIHASAAYRRSLFATLLERALARAAA